MNMEYVLKPKQPRLRKVRAANSILMLKVRVTSWNKWERIARLIRKTNKFGPHSEISRKKANHIRNVWCKH